MKLEEFRKTCNEVYDNPVLSKFNKMFCELILKAPEEKAEKLMRALPATTKEIEDLRGLK